MARIRSVHPGLFTDEAFALLSSDAQIFLVGLWTEADDKGIFEWKPGQLRIRLRPGKDGDVPAIMAELLHANCIKDFSIGGKPYGAIRNFRKYQRPKTPNSIYPMTPEIGNYVGLNINNSETNTVNGRSNPYNQDVKGQPLHQNRESKTTNDDQFLQKVEKSPQMEEGGDKRKEEGDKKKESPPSPTKPIQSDYDLMLGALSKIEGIQKHSVTTNPDCSGIWQLIQQGYNLKTEIIPVVAGIVLRAKRPIKSWNFFVSGIIEAKQGQTLSQSINTEIDWKKRLEVGRKMRQWDEKWGPIPHDPDCRVPPHMLLPSDGKTPTGERWLIWIPPKT